MLRGFCGVWGVRKKQGLYGGSCEACLHADALVKDEYAPLPTKNTICFKTP